MLKCKNKIICKNVKICKSIFSKALGLMFSFPINDKCLIFIFDNARRIDLHMFFVFYPIDVLFLDEGKKVVEIKERFLPFRIYYSKNKCNYVIELPLRVIKDKGIKVGDVLEW